MLFALLSATLALLLDLLHADMRGEHDKMLEIVVLRHQLCRYGCLASPKPRLSRWDKVVLATIVAKYRDLANALVLVKPDAVLRWHRAILRRKWTYGTTPKRGRPATPAATAELIVRLARENRCPGRLAHPWPNPGTLASGLPESNAGWPDRPGQRSTLLDQLLLVTPVNRFVPRIVDRRRTWRPCGEGDPF